MKKTIILLFIIFVFFSFIYAETVVDDVGRKVELKLPVSSVVSLSPAHTEMIYFLGKEDKLKAVSVNCNYPDGAVLKDKAGTFLNPDIEKILKLNPDLVISGGGIQKKAIKNLENLKIPVLVLYPVDINGIVENMNLLSFILGCKNCFEKIRKFENQCKPRKTKNLRIYVELWDKPIMTVGRTSFLSDIIKRTGSENIFNDSKQEYPKISDETVIAKKPDVIILLYEPENNFKEKPRFKNTPAGKDNNIFIMTKQKQDIFLRTGPRVVDAINMLEDILNKVKK